MNDVKVLNFDDMTIQVVTLTQELAAKWATKGWREGNRKLKRKHASKLQKDMENGTYYPNPLAMICFDEEGHLVNGQHTLTAFINSKLPSLLVMMCKNMPKKTVGVLDSGAGRSFKDAFKFLCSGETVNTKAVPIVRALLGDGLTTEEIADACVEHQDAIEFALKHLRGKGRTRAPFLAVVVAAYYSAPRARLEEFCKVVSQGWGNGSVDAAACKLTEYLLTLKGGSGSLHKEVAQKTRAMLQDFLRGVESKSVWSWTGEDPFPLPRE